MLLSLFCGAGGMDLGFEQAGFRIGLAFDQNSASIQSYCHNRPGSTSAHVRDVRQLTPAVLDGLYGQEFAPQGIIGGPPCQSFTQAVHGVSDDDPRHELPLVYARLLAALNERNPIQFFVLENVPGLWDEQHATRYSEILDALTDAGFRVHSAILNARDYSTAQHRERIFLVGLNREMFAQTEWPVPPPTTKHPRDITVRAAIRGLADPVFFTRGADPSTFPEHPNHWCMRPKSQKFTRPGALVPGDGRHRSFKTLAWDQPSFTVAYGHREVHVHPNCTRRLSVFEAMKLQGFPREYVLQGTLSSQFTQVSEAVPPPLARAVAESVRNLTDVPAAALPEAA